MVHLLTNGEVQVFDENSFDTNSFSESSWFMDTVKRVAEKLKAIRKLPGYLRVFPIFRG
jgi:hypothetical protein